MENNSKKSSNKNSAVSENSAGGVVVRRINGRMHIALLRTKHVRGDVWVLPKGHIEMQLGETNVQAAVRETKEELGIQNVIVKRALGQTRYDFFTERGRVTKTVYYFLMESSDDKLHPQAEEGLLEASWMPVRMALKKITYQTDREVILRAISSRRPVSKK